MEQLLKQYNEMKSKAKAFGYAMWMISWDSETEAPKGAMEYRSKQIGVLSSEMYNLRTSPEAIKLINELYEKKDALSEIERKEIIEGKRDIDKIVKIPKEEYVAFQILISQSPQIWAQARAKNDFEAFRPTLEKIIEFSKKYISYLQTDELKGYDVLLDEYERGMKKADYDVFFDKLKKDLVPFALKVSQTKMSRNDDFMKLKYSKEKQKEFVEYLIKVFRFDTDRGVLKESSHPFTSGVCTSDVRFTVRYQEDFFVSSIFAAIHEMGHAIYNQQHAPELDDTFLNGGASLGIHESQSRFYENTIGRSLAFWETHYPKLQSIFPDQLGKVSLSDFYQAINKVETSLIRVEADELTYALHIMLRYEIEKGLLEGQVEVKDLPIVWDELMLKYLGIKSPNHALGVLQDIHWSAGLIGYFPTYALGSAYGAHIHHAMQKEMDVEKAIREDKISLINEWLKNKIHKYGATKEPLELIKMATNEEFDASYYVNYLIRKYSELYKIA